AAWCPRRGKAPHSRTAPSPRTACGPRPASGPRATRSRARPRAPRTRRRASAAPSSAHALQRVAGLGEVGVARERALVGAARFLALPARSEELAGAQVGLRVSARGAVCGAERARGAGQVAGVEMRQALAVAHGGPERLLPRRLVEAPD